MHLEDGSPFPEGDRERQQRLAHEMGVAFADLDRVRPEAAARESLPVALARELRVLPVKRDGNTLWVALGESNQATLAKVTDATGLRVVPVLAVPDALAALRE